MDFMTLLEMATKRCDFKISEEEFINWLDENIEVNTYIPITMKYAVASIFSNNLKDVEEIDKSDLNICYFMMYDIGIMFDVLFRYIDVTALPDDKTSYNYDIFCKSGLKEYILNICKEDYNELVQICDRITAINQFALISSLSSFINPIPTTEDIDKIVNLFNNQLDKEKLQLVKDINLLNDPKMNKVLENIKKQSINEIMGRIPKNGKR